jgi:hypothetical protein
MRMLADKYDFILPHIVPHAKYPVVRCGRHVLFEDRPPAKELSFLFFRV